MIICTLTLEVSNSFESFPRGKTVFAVYTNLQKLYSNIKIGINCIIVSETCKYNNDIRLCFSNLL